MCFYRSTSLLTWHTLKVECLSNSATKTATFLPMELILLSLKSQYLLMLPWGVCWVNGWEIVVTWLKQWVETRGWVTADVVRCQHSASEKQAFYFRIVLSQFDTNWLIVLFLDTNFSKKVQFLLWINYPARHHQPFASKQYSTHG